jgi:hypothetical protein
MTSSLVPTLVVGGWVVASPTALPAGLSREIPDPFITISYCLADGLVTPEFYSWFQNLDEARSAAIAPADVIGVGLTPADAETFMAEVSSDAPFEQLKRGQVATAPALLGYEIVGAEQLFWLHSWHCHQYAELAARDLGVDVNGLGLIDDYEAAVRVRTWMLNQPSEDQAAPVPWTVVALWREPDQRGPG